MTQSDLNLGWEWRAQRAVNQRVGLRIESLKKEKPRFFGLLNSPSLGSSLPDPMNITGKVISVDRQGTAIAGQTIAFRVPRMEVKDVKVGDLIAIGIIGEMAVCIAPAPDEVGEDNIAGWLPEAECS